jgi:Ca-activated chloride channel family protein
MIYKKSLVVLITFVFCLCCSSLLFAQTVQPTPTPETTAEDDEVIKVDTALVNVPFSVSDRDGRSILGLKAENFTLFEDGKPTKIEYLSTQDAPLNVVLILDTSQSAKDRFDKIKNAASEFIKQLRPTDKCMIVSVDAAARVKSEFTKSQTKLNRAINRIVLSEKPGTLLRDAVSVIVEKELPKVKGRKAIILITDGKDAGSLISEKQLLHDLVESDAPIYSILYETTPSVDTSNQPIKPVVANGKVKYDEKKKKQFLLDQEKKNEEAAQFMQKISEITAGRSYRKEVNLDEAFISITEELRKQYLIGFYPEEENYNISKHQIRIKIDRKNAVVRLKNLNLLK